MEGVFNRNTQRNWYIVSHSGPWRTEYSRKIVLKFAAYIVYNIGKRMEESLEPFSRQLLGIFGPWKQMW